MSTLPQTAYAELLKPIVKPIAKPTGESVTEAIGAFSSTPGLPAGRTVRAVIDAEPQHLNPLLDPDLWGYRIAHNLLCEPLVRPRKGAEGDGAAAYEGILAERFRVDADGQGIDLWVRKGVRFHDGHPLTAYDVRMTLEMVMRAGPSAPRTAALLADVTRVLVIGKEVVHLDLRRLAGPTRSILAALSAIDILPASQFPNGRLAYQPFNRRPVCSGPYRLVEWKRGSHLLLRRSPTYWGSPAASEELRFNIAADGARGLAQLRQGDADMILRVAPRYLSDQVEPAAQRGRWRKVEIDANQLVALLWNGRHPALGQAGVRRALSAHIDRERLIREVRSGLGTPVADPVLSEADAHPSPAILELLADSLRESPDRSIQAAGAQLDEAGITRLSPGGLRLFQGRPLVLRTLVPAGSSELAEVSRRIGEAVLRSGIKWETEVLDLPTLMGRLRRGAYDTALLAWSWTGGDRDLDLLALLPLSLPDKSPLLGELTAAAHVGRLTPLWRREQPITLLYRPRQLAVLGPAVRPFPVPTIEDAIDLQHIYTR